MNHQADPFKPQKCHECGHNWVGIEGSTCGECARQEAEAGKQLESAAAIRTAAAFIRQHNIPVEALYSPEELMGWYKFITTPA